MKTRCQPGRMLGSTASGAPFALATNNIAVNGSALLKLDATNDQPGAGCDDSGQGQFGLAGGLLLNSGRRVSDPNARFRITA